MNLEGIRFSETPEHQIEKKSITIGESNNQNFSDNAKKTEAKINELESLKKELLDFSDCIKTEQVQVNEIEDDFEDCRKR